MPIHKGKKHITSHGNCTGSSWRVKEYFEVYSRNESARNEDDGHTRTSSWQWWTQLINMYVNGWLQPDNRSKINKHEGLIPYVLRKLMLQYQHDDVRVRRCYGMPRNTAWPGHCGSFSHLYLSTKSHNEYAKGSTEPIIFWTFLFKRTFNPKNTLLLNFIFLASI